MLLNTDTFLLRRVNLRHQRLLFVFRNDLCTWSTYQAERLKKLLLLCGITGVLILQELGGVKMFSRIFPFSQIIWHTLGKNWIKFNENLNIKNSVVNKALSMRKIYKRYFRVFARVCSLSGTIRVCDTLTPPLYAMWGSTGSCFENCHSNLSLDSKDKICPRNKIGITLCTYAMFTVEISSKSCTSVTKLEKPRIHHFAVKAEYVLLIEKRCHSC